QSGSFTWKPALPRAGFTYTVTVLVTDDGTPNLTSSRTFNVRVLNSGSEPVFALLPAFADNHSVALRFTGVPGTEYITQYTTRLQGFWINLATNMAGLDGFWSVFDSGPTDVQRFYRVTLKPEP